MARLYSGILIGILAVSVASLVWAGPETAAFPGANTTNTPNTARISKPAKNKVSPKPAVKPKTEVIVAQPKPILADAFIAQNVLRVFLNRPAVIFVYNSRGQQVYHLDSQRSVEEVPLHGVNTGFVYLTVRTAQGELTKKLVYTGK